MVVVRATRDVLASLPKGPTDVAESDTALGDWFVTRVVIDRRPLLLLMSSASYLTILIPARDVAGLPERLDELVAARLQRMGVEQRLIDAEVAAMSPVMVGKTNDRTVVGILVQFAMELQFHLPAGIWDAATFAEIEERMARNPCHAGKRSELVIWARDKAPELLRERWRLGELASRTTP